MTILCDGHVNFGPHCRGTSTRAVVRTVRSGNDLWLGACRGADRLPQRTISPVF